LAGIFPGPFRDETKAINRGLNRHRLSLLTRIPPLDEINLAREGIEARADALVQKQRELVLGCTFGEGTLEQPVSRSNQLSV
jgi:hypothetical protein